MKNGKLYTITGLPYAGKTTLTNELIKRFGFILVSVDEIMDKKNMWRTGHPTQDDWNEAYSEAYSLLKEFLNSGKSVIFDGGSLKFKERETQRLIAKELGATHKLIYVNTPKKEILERRKENLKTKERGHLENKVLNIAFQMFEEPTHEENPIIFNQNLDLEKWIQNVIG